MIPLQLSRPYSFSGFLSEGCSVVLIGTVKYDSILKQSFLNYLKGSKEDADDFVTRELSNYKQSTQLRNMAQSSSSIIDSSTSNMELNSEHCHENARKQSLLIDDHEGIAEEISRVEHIDMLPTSYYYISSSSDEELPRVQVTGRSNRNIAAEAASSEKTRPQHVQNNSLEMDVPKQCPICGMIFPVRYAVSILVN